MAVPVRSGQPVAWVHHERPPAAFPVETPAVKGHGEVVDDLAGVGVRVDRRAGAEDALVPVVRVAAREGRLGTETGEGADLVRGVDQLPERGVHPRNDERTRTTVDGEPAAL